MNIPVTMHSDEKGYIDRECPNEECLFNFKIYAEDWKEKVSDEAVYCPLCGHVDTSDKWWTQKQLEDIRNIAMNYATNYINTELNKIFKPLERKTKNSMISFKYKSARNKIIDPNIFSMPEWELELQCENCKTRYSIKGNAHFCPCCGVNTVDTVFERQLEIIKEQVDSIENIKESINSDNADAICSKIIENSFCDCISAYQKFAFEKYKKCKGESKVKVNDFQIIEKGEKLFKEIFNTTYSDWISEKEKEDLNTFFQRRHILEHNNGIVDEKYKEKTNDSSYALGRRIIVNENNVYDLLDIIKKVSKQINENAKIYFKS